jgi:hypothetical protein
LNAIVTLAESHPDYQTGFNVILTTDKFFDDNWDRSGEIWQSAAWGQGGSAWYYGPVWYSARSVFDNTITPKFHAPDFFLNYQQQIASNGGSSTWISDGRREETIEYFSGLIIHEYGHYFNLGHTTICSNNYMSRGGFNISQNYSQFSADQIRELYKSLMFRNLGEVVKCIDRADAPFIIDADETWSADTRIFRDIIVESGSKLEITCTLHMQPGSRIFVKRGAELHVNGGTITGCGEYWNGIRVEGYSDFTAQLQSAAGLVRIDNGAIIENAKNIVSMWNGHISWPQVQEYYGGLVIADNVTFRDSWRAVEFMRYASNGHLDKSTFTNCTFEDLRIGVSNWESDGVTFDNCTFNRISKMCILPYNSEVDINIQVGSTIKNPQGGGQLNNEPADNRFVHSSSFGWNAIDNYQFNGELEYVSRTLDQNSEFRPRNSINVVVSLGASFELFDACNDLNPFTGSTPDSLVLAYCATDEGLTGGLGGAVLPPGSAQDCRRERELTYAKQLTHSGMIDAAAQHLLSSLEFDTRIFGFGVYLTAARITDARTSLATLSPVSQEEQDFVWTQDLYLNFLDSPQDAYTLTPADSTQLLNIAQSRDQYSGYARSIYQVITEERITAALAPIKETKSLSAPSQTGEKSINIFDAYPNPVHSGELNVLLNEEAISGTGWTLSLSDTRGKLLIQKTVDGLSSVMIDLSDLSNGIYVLQLSSIDGVHHAQKVVKM